VAKKLKRVFTSDINIDLTGYLALEEGLKDPDI